MRFVSDQWTFLRTHKKLVLLPILIVVLLFAVLLILDPPRATPFIFTVF